MMATTPLTRLAAPERRALPAAVRRRLGIGVLTLAALVFYLWHSLGDQAGYLTTGYDLGIFDQAVRAYAHFQAPIVPLKGVDYNIFGDHFHPIIVVLAPLYWIWDNPDMLLIAQAVLIAASIPVVYRFVRRRAGEGMSLLITAAYAFGWPVQGLIDFDFHEIAFATPFTALAIDALDRRDDRRLLLWCGLLLLVREDMGLLVALFGVLRLVQRRRPRWPVVAMVVGGFAMYILTTSVIIPHFAEGHGFAYGNQFSSLGSSVPAAIVNIITTPWHAVHVFFTPSAKTHTLAFLVVPLALLCFRSRYALLALPLLAERFFNSRRNLWTETFHYNALPWLILVMAMVDGADRLGLFDANRRAVLLRRALGVLLVATPLVLIFIGDNVKVLPVNQLRNPYAHQPHGWLSSAKAVVRWLPDDVCVAADNHLVPHLTERDYTSVPQADTPNPDFYALDMFAPDTGGNPPAPKPNAVYAQAITDGYHVVFRSGTFVVLQSPTYSGPSSACKPLGPGKSG
ncbi:MAG: putative rane protein [Pseudonocardiales bacterium]|jgi:uncharacterized membrane protein|nr:putative rane protein [Pseudonocardiales bacterium]